MKKKYKLIVFAAAICALCLISAYRLLKPADEVFYKVIREDMREDLNAKGYLVPDTIQVISAILPGVVIEAPTPGQLIPSDRSPILLDDKNAERQLTDQIEALKLQQTAMSSDSLQKQEQISAQLAKIRLEYENLFLNGTAQAKRDAAQAEYTQAGTNYKNNLVLRDGGYISEQELQGSYLKLMTARQQFSEADFASSASARSYYEDMIHSSQLQLQALKEIAGGKTSAGQAGVAQLQITIDGMEKRLSDAKAPAGDIRGIVYEVYVSPGQYVSEDTPLFSVYQEGETFIQAELLADELNGISEGMSAELQFSDRSEGKGCVDFISTVAQEDVSSIGLTEDKCIVKISAPEVPAGSGPGFPVDITFRKVLAENTLSAPLSAIVPGKDGESCVYLIKGRKKVLTPVTTGVKGGGRIQILSGITEGDSVITDPLP